MIICLKDKAKGTFSSPMLVETIDEAKRSLIMCFMNGERSLITQFPSMYELYKVSEFDVKAGIMTPVNPEFIIDGYTAKLQAIENIKATQVDVTEQYIGKESEEN